MKPSREMLQWTVVKVGWCMTYRPGPTDELIAMSELVSRWWLWLEGGVPPPVGAFTGRPLAGGDGWWGLCGWSGQRRVGQVLAVGVGDDELVGGPNEGDPAGVVQAVVVRTDEDEVVQLGQAAVLPMNQVMGVQAAGRAAAGHHTTAIPMLQRPTQPPVDRARRAAGADRAPGPFEPHLTGRITGKVLALDVGEQRTQMQRTHMLVDVDVHDHRGVLGVRAPRHLGVPAGGDQLHEGVSDGLCKSC